MEKGKWGVGSGTWECSFLYQIAYLAVWNNKHIFKHTKENVLENITTGPTK